VTSRLCRTDLRRDDCINQSVGMSNHADIGKICVVRAYGNVLGDTANGFLRVGSNTVKMVPGTAIVVPLDSEHLPPLAIWQRITQILRNTAGAVAAIQSHQAGKYAPSRDNSISTNCSIAETPGF
jgi:hypothetical protein